MIIACLKFVEGWLRSRNNGNIGTHLTCTIILLKISENTLALQVHYVHGIKT